MPHCYAQACLCRQRLLLSGSQCPEKYACRGMFNDDLIAKMKKGAVRTLPSVHCTGYCCLSACQLLASLRRSCGRAGAPRLHISSRRQSHGAGDAGRPRGRRLPGEQCARGDLRRGRSRTRAGTGPARRCAALRCARACAAQHRHWSAAAVKCFAARRCLATACVCSSVGQGVTQSAERLRSRSWLARPRRVLGGRVAAAARAQVRVALFLHPVLLCSRQHVGRLEWCLCRAP